MFRKTVHAPNFGAIIDPSIRQGMPCSRVLIWKIKTTLPYGNFT